MEELREKYLRFKEWQHQPYKVAPLSKEPCDCSTCGTHFEGNYCPRCGQPAHTARYSFKKALLLFLDVWGLGNRGMFRTLRDLMLRPGYMIHDYLIGMRMAYFPPFKMFFLLITLSLLVDSGMNIQGVNRIKQGQEMFEKGVDDAKHESKQETAQESETEKAPDKTLTAEELERQKKAEELGKRISDGSSDITKKAFEWVYQHLTLVMLAGLLLLSWPLYLMFRHCPNIPDMHYSEFFVAMVYTTNMITIYSIISSLLCLDLMVEFFIYPLAIIPIKQMSGYSYWSTFWRILVAVISFSIIAIVLFFGIGIISSIVYINLT